MSLIEPNTEASVSALVGNIRKLGIDVPENLDKELALAKTLKTDDVTRHAALGKARAAVENAADVKAFTKARDDLAGLMSVELAKSSPAFQDYIGTTVNRRLSNALFDASPGFQQSLSDKFNSIVDDYRLNELIRDLPDLTNPTLKPVDMNAKQGKALDAWREGAEKLHKVWGVYSQLAFRAGVQLGARDEISPNIDLAYVLGEVPEHRYVMGSATTVGAAQELGMWVGNTDTAKRYGRLAPFVLLPVCNIPLHLKPLDEAQQLRQELQFN